MVQKCPLFVNVHTSYHRKWQCIGEKVDFSGETEGLHYYRSNLDTVEPWLVKSQWYYCRLSKKKPKQ